MEQSKGLSLAWTMTGKFKNAAGLSKELCWQNRAEGSFLETLLEEVTFIMAVMLLTLGVDLTPTLGARFSFTWAAWRPAARPGLMLFGGLTYQVGS